MERERRAVWDKAIRHFSKHHEFLNNWRNDVGGHFLDRAARYAIDEIHQDTVGTIEFVRTNGGADLKMPFAYELVAMALTKNKNTPQPERDFLETVFDVLAKTVVAAALAVHVLVEHTIAKRF